MSEKKPLTVEGRYDLLTDSRRRRVVLPHKVLALISELHEGLVLLMDAVGASTNDPRWKEAADLLEATRELLARPALEKPLERARAVFESRLPIDVKRLRKGMARVRDVARKRTSGLVDTTKWRSRKP